MSSLVHVQLIAKGYEGSPVSRINGTPNAARQPERDDDSERTQDDQIPHAVVVKGLFKNEKDHRSDDGALEGTNAADQHHEDHECRVLDGKG